MPKFKKHDVGLFHTDYQNLFRKFVDRELKNNFGQEVIDQFFATFLTEQANYSTVDQETSQAIIELLDKDAFLNKMRLWHQVYL